ncbi:MAG: tRNA delta(2)-isopentenylpyrophosphate transferase [Candidatus Magasanikbacteria bacterium]|nr:tRNA delta(2)-isopentenylpyrophosphate transferase [Candidatus Magasanikbacteria bacterium]
MWAPSKPLLITIVGPTASGKTDVAIFLAKKFNGEVLNADSRQIYRDFTIGTGKPLLRGQQKTSGRMPLARSCYDWCGPVASGRADSGRIVDGVPHFGFDLIPPTVRFSAADFQKYARRVIDGIISRGHLPILVGGTGLYISGVVDNLVFPPAPDLKLRARLERLPLKTLWRMLKRRDPQTATQLLKDGQDKNRRRLARYLEIIMPTGEPLAETQKKTASEYNVLQFGLAWPRKKLFERIDKRVDKMMRDGWLKEVRRLVKKYGANVPAMTSLGYRELAAGEPIVKIKAATHEYARRQMRWFKRDKSIKWVPGGKHGILKTYGIIDRTVRAKIHASGIQTGARPFGRKKNATSPTRFGQSRNGQTF